jgi:hypothetical protein
MRVSASLGFLLGLTLASPAAAVGPPLLLGVSDCGELDEREVRRLVVAELGAIPVEQHGPGVTLVTVRCTGLRVVVRVDDPLSKKTVARGFDTGPLDPRARARWVALAASELVLSSWVELDTNPTPKVEPEGPAAPAPARRAAQAAVRRRTPVPTIARASALGRPGATVRAPVVAQRVQPQRPAAETEAAEPRLAADKLARNARAVALVSARRFFDDSGSLWGGGVRLSEERFRHISWSADLLFEAGSVASRLTDYRLRSGTVGGWLMLYERANAITLRLGAGIRMGVIASLASNAPDGTPASASAVAPWGWPLAATSISVAGGPIVIEYSMEAGYVVLPVGGTSGPSVRGGWFSGQLGLGVQR